MAWTDKLNLRKLPHPEYGNYLGANRRCYSKSVEKKGQGCPIPVDDLDFIGVRHDFETQDQDDIFPDIKFAWRMLGVNPFDRSNYDFTEPTTFLNHHYLIDPRYYQFGSAVVMGILGLITPFTRLAKKVWREF